MSPESKTLSLLTIKLIHCFLKSLDEALVSDSVILCVVSIGPIFGVKSRAFQAPFPGRFLCFSICLTQTTDCPLLNWCIYFFYLLCVLKVIYRPWLEFKLLYANQSLIFHIATLYSWLFLTLISAQFWSFALPDGPNCWSLIYRAL